MEFKVTKREIMVTIAITLILIGLGFIISSSIKNSIYESNEKYYKSLKINDDIDMFKHALNTNIGYVMAHGTISGINGVNYDGVDGNYFYIKKVKEEYTRHTRQVAHTRTVPDGNGGTKTETYYTTEVYYEWDYVGSENKHVEQFTFLGSTFNYDTIGFSNDSYVKTIKVSSNIRYKYYAIPLSFDGTLFTYIKDNTITDNDFTVGLSLEETLKRKTNISGAIVGFWLLWIILIGLLDFGYVYLENNYLED